MNSRRMTPDVLKSRTTPEASASDYIDRE